MAPSMSYQMTLLFVVRKALVELLTFAAFSPAIFLKSWSSLEHMKRRRSVPNETQIWGYPQLIDGPHSSALIKQIFQGLDWPN